MGNCRANEHARASALLSESSSIELGMPLTLVKLAIARKFFRDACSSASLTWSLRYRRRIKKSLGLRRDMLSGHCVMCRHVENMRFHSTTYAMVANLLSKRTMLSTFSVSARCLLSAETDCLALRFLST